MIYKFFTFFVGMALLFSTVAYAAEVRNDHHYILKYDVYAGGFHALKAQYESTQTEGNYSLNIKTATNGFIGNLFPWSGAYETKGLVDKDNQFTPTSHTSTSMWQGQSKEKSLAFKDGKIISFTDTEGKKSHTYDKLKTDLTSDAQDLLTASLTAFNGLEPEQGCKSSGIAFDGKRKFKVKLTDGETVSLRKSKYSSFAGDALKCTLQVEALAGFKDKDQKRGWMLIQNHTEEHGKKPSVWFSQLQENGPMVPVRMQIASRYGTVIAHLTSFSIPSLSNLNTAAGQ